jgi:NIPSNAP
MGLIGGMGAAMAAAGAASPNSKRTGFYVIENFFLKNGTQVPRIHEYLSKGAIPSIQKIHNGPIIALEALVAAHMPQVSLILGFASLEELWNVHGKVIANDEWQTQYRAWEDGPEAPYESRANVLLQATEYSPEIEISREPRKTPRVFELRVYHAPTGRQLTALHERFAGSEIKIFHRSGIQPLFYSSTIFGTAIPNLTYLIPFDSLAEREKAWAAFGGDPEWSKVRADSIAKHGQISSIIQMSLFKATPYSPVQ